jgi:ABC-type Mn2+/Zn2+ transport system permease subunit
MIQRIQKEIKETQKEFKEKSITLIIAGFGVVAALAWNEAIKSFFDNYLPKSSGLIGKFFYAIIITLIVVVFSRYLEKISEKKE